MLVIGAVTAMVVIAFVVPLATLVRDLASDRALTAAEREIERVTRAVALGAGDGNLLVAVGNLQLDGGEFAISIVVDGEVFGYEISDDPNVATAQGGAAFRASVSEGQAIYAPVVVPTQENAVVVRVLVTASQLTAGVVRSWAILGMLSLVLVLIALAVTDRLGRSIVEPVRDLSAVAARLGDGQLDARVVPSGPLEVREVGAQLNRLAGQITTLLRLEREAAADLSHRLRTPLTAVRLDVEAIADEAIRERVVSDLDELERTIDFVISSARRSVVADGDPTCDLAEVASARFEFWSALAEEQGRVGALRIDDGEWVVDAGVSDVTAMIDALLGNVMAHTAEGTAFGVEVSGDGAMAVLTVTDEGSGFDPGLAARGRSAAGSTGLGLDIVRRTAEASGGWLQIETTPQGGPKIVISLGLTKP